MEYLNDYYVTAIGSTLASETTDPFGYGATVEQVAASTASATSTSSSGSTFASTTTDNSSSHGLSLTAIDGIAAGISVGGVLILGLIAFFCVRQRKRRRLAAASVPFQNTAQPQPMQQQPMQPAVMQQQEPQGLPPKAFDGYQAVAQQEQAPQYTQYPSPPSQSQPQPQQPQQQQTGYFPPPSAASAISPQTTGASDPRLSTANNTLLSPASDTSTDHRQSSYKTPVSPTVTEVDGTMGNPGVPHGGHGIAGQTQPGGSPSAQEIDGRVGASMTGPSEHEGPFELGHREGR